VANHTLVLSALPPLAKASHKTTPWKVQAPPETEGSNLLQNQCLGPVLNNQDRNLKGHTFSSLHVRKSQNTDTIAPNSTFQVSYVNFHHNLCFPNQKGIIFSLPKILSLEYQEKKKTWKFGQGLTFIHKVLKQHVRHNCFRRIPFFFSFYYLLTKT
jgi:hypothetical protein